MSAGEQPALPPHQDSDQWDKLIESIGPASILVLINRWIGHDLRAQLSPEDIWQEGLGAAWRDRHQLQWAGPARFRAWLLEIIRNRIRDEARKMSSEQRGGKVETLRMPSSSDSESGSMSSFLPPGSTTPSRTAIHKELADAMERCLHELPPELEPVVRMYLFEELTMEAIAKQLGIGISAAWYRFRKGSEIYSRCLDRAKGESEA